jgi:hypothetical protein
VAMAGADPLALALALALAWLVSCTGWGRVPGVGSSSPRDTDRRAVFEVVSHVTQLPNCSTGTIGGVGRAGAEGSQGQPGVRVGPRSAGL